MYAISKRRAKLPLYLLMSAFCAALMFLLRQSGQVNFGVHTMLMLLVMNILSVLVLKLDVKPSILGSLIVTALIIGGEVINYSLLLLFNTQDVIDVKMEEAMFKAWAAVPGNIILIVVVVIIYVVRVRKGKKKG